MSGQLARGIVSNDLINSLMRDLDRKVSLKPSGRLLWRPVLPQTVSDKQDNLRLQLPVRCPVGHPFCHLVGSDPIVTRRRSAMSFDFPADRAFADIYGMSNSLQRFFFLQSQINSISLLTGKMFIHKQYKNIKPIGDFGLLFCFFILLLDFLKSQLKDIGGSPPMSFS